jgi:hypothetical protein
MEEQRIKRAWEIAQEKIASRPDLSADALRRQKEREFEPIGEAIAKKYLGGAIRATELKTEFSKYRSAEGQIVKRALISRLVQSIEPGEAAGSKRAMDGLQIFTGPNSHFAEARDAFEKIVSEFEGKVLQQRKEFEALEREKLKKLGITGSAIRPNVKENQDWQQMQSKIRQSYDVKVNKLRKGLMQLIEIA